MATRMPNDLPKIDLDAAPTKMPREYVISSPTGFRAAAGRYENLLVNLHYQPTVTILESLHENAEKLALMDEDEVRTLKTNMPGLVIEPNLRYKLLRHPLIDDFNALGVPAAGPTQTITVRVTAAGNGTPVPDTSVYLVINMAQRTGYTGTTDANGDCRITTTPGTNQFEAVIALPTAGFWGYRADHVTIVGPLAVSLQALPSEQPEVYDWGHALANMRDELHSGGAGVTIGIIDTGISDHADLSIAGGSNCVFGEDPNDWRNDAEGHGTHCAGIVAALLNNAGIKGYAPHASIRSYRVFPSSGQGAATFDIMKAIDTGVEDGCDVLSMSLGLPTPQSGLRAKTEAAYDKGVLCIAATGNEATSVSYPAAFPSVTAVSAFGRLGSYPPDSPHHWTESNLRSTDGTCFFANFANFGPEVDFCAPGVAIRSTVPKGYSAWDGTSMACPQLTGIAALLLCATPELLNGARDATRVEGLLQLLRGAAQPLGFGAQYEGAAPRSALHGVHRAYGHSKKSAW